MLKKFSVALLSLLSLSLLVACAGMPQTVTVVETVVVEKEVEKVVRSKPEATVEEIIKQALKNL